MRKLFQRADKLTIEITKHDEVTELSWEVRASKPIVEARGSVHCDPEHVDTVVDLLASITGVKS